MMEYRCEECGQTFERETALKSHQRHKHNEVGAYPETKAVAKSGSLDAAVEKLQVPVIPEKYNGSADIFWEGFNRGVTYGASTILVGIRSAQELSSLGIAQATPIIKMAQEMRQAEGMAAQEMAAQLAQSNMQSSQQIIAALNNLAASQPGAPDPGYQMVIEVVKPLFQQTMQGLLGGVLGGFQRGQAAPGQSQPPPGQAQPPQGQFQGAAGPAVEDADQGPVTHDDWGALPGNVSRITDEEDINV